MDMQEGEGVNLERGKRAREKRARREGVCKGENPQCVSCCLKRIRGCWSPYAPASSVAAAVLWVRQAELDVQTNCSQKSCG
jgi:hypothetical protein